MLTSVNVQALAVVPQTLEQTAAPAAKHKQMSTMRIALGRAVMSASRNVAADHFADRSPLLPAYVSFVRVRHQRQPIIPRRATDLHANGSRLTFESRRGFPADYT